MTARVRRTGALLAAITAGLSLWSASPALAQDCGPTAAFSAAFDDLPSGLSVVPICPSDVGPGFGDPKPAAQFSTLTAGEVTDTGLDPNLVVLNVLVGTL